jgi:membrane protease YdiL (CAAX protease family)
VNQSSGVLRRHPVLCYFFLTFAISWSAAFCVAAPHLLRHEPLPQLTGILMFPAMLLGPSVAGILLTRILEGRAGLRALFSRLFRWRVPSTWYLTLLLPPALVLTVLFLLETFVSPVYAPNRFWLGILFGVPAGLLEEIGWSGFAFPKWLSGKNTFAVAVALGLLWVLWHAPVINFLGVATPHGQHWLAFFLAFGVAMTAIRVLICWIYRHTGSVLLTQLMHISSTGALVIFGAPRVNAIQEATWYAVYGAALWLVVLAVLLHSRSALASRHSDSPPEARPG